MEKGPSHYPWAAAPDVNSRFPVTRLTSHAGLLELALPFTENVRPNRLPAYNHQGGEGARKTHCNPSPLTTSIKIRYEKLSRDSWRLR